MSRAPFFDQIHLTTQQGPSGTALVVSSTSSFIGSSFKMTCDEFYAFRLLMFHLSQITNGHNGLTFLKKISPNKDTLLHIFSFLYSNTDMVRLIAPKLSEYEQLEGISSAEITNALNHAFNADGTASVLQQKIAKFKTKLEDYVNKTRPLHNDFILAKAYEIYGKKLGLWTTDQFFLFSETVIGLIQKCALKTSKKRSMDIAEGIYNRAQNIDKQLPARRSLLLVKPTTDIRSVVDLGSRCCIDICGGRGSIAELWYQREVPQAFFTKVVSSKNSVLGKLIASAISHQPRSCSVM